MTIGKRLLTVGLLGTTALVIPTPADALPLIALLQSVAPALFFAAPAAGSFLSGLGAFGTFAGSIGGRILIGAGLSLLSQALAPSPALPPPSERLTNFAQSVTYAEWVLGRTRKGGFLGFTGFQDSTDVVTGTTGAKRHYTPVVAAHPCEGVVTHYLDERVVEIDGDGLVTTSPMTDFYRIRPFLGAPGQTADAELVNSFTEITSDYDFEGLTGAHIWARRPPESQFSDIYPTGRQGAWTPVIDGHNGVYDPRGGGSTGYTRNAALLMAFWLTEILGKSVDWDEVGDEADVCDALVTTRYEGTIPRWRIGGTLSDEQEFETQRAQMAVACDAWMYERADGKVGFRVGRYITPTITLTQADFQQVNFSEGGFGRNAPSEVAGRYVEPEYAWREWSSGAYVLDASARQVREEPALYMVGSHNQASRLNKRIGKTKRPTYALTGRVGLIGYYLRGHRFVRIQAMGFDEVFEIGELWRNEGGLSFDIVANSVESSDFDFVAASEEPDRPALAQVVSSDDVADVSGLVGTPDGNYGISWNWTAADPAYTQQIRLRVKPAGDWVVHDVPAGQRPFTTSGLASDDYQAQARNVTAAKREGAWKPDTPAEATSTGVSPGAATIDSVTASPGRLAIVGTAAANTVGIRLGRATADDFSASVSVSDILPVSALAAFSVTAGDADAINIVSNGTFASSANWTEGGDWSTTGGKATTNGSNSGFLSQTVGDLAVTPSEGDTLRITGAISGRTAGNLYVRLAGTTDNDSATISDNGVFTVELVVPAAMTHLRFFNNGAFDGSLDDVSVVVDTPACLPSGQAYYWIVPVSGEGVEGPESSSFLRTVT